MSAPERAQSGLEVAILGMAGRFPGACSVEEFWANLCAGVESVSHFSREELAASQIPSADLDHPAYVPARAWIAGAERFDAGFFGFNPREAEITDPQHRLFLECAWEALESAGCDPATFPGRIGVFAGAGLSTYLLSNLLGHEEMLREVGSFQVMIANDKDYLPTRVSYKLDLRGPSVLVQTACSTSLVAVHLACQSLANGECEMALAGAASVGFPQKRGYLYQEGGIFSPDGRCRPYDAAAQGTVNGDGVAAVVLKRLEDAVADGDPIRAVLLGSAINNDGAAKVGFTAPSVEGQVLVIAAAQAVAGVSAEDIGYVEGHGTATPLGDPIEVAALTEAFRATTRRRGFCALGSLKGNVGHLDTVSGIAGLIKAALAVERGILPPSLHFERPNPALELADSPFHVVRELRPWPEDGRPRCAAVSSFGIGGTNAHAVLLEPPPPPPTTASRGVQLLLLSARSEGSLERATAALALHLAARSDLDLADVCHTLRRGRRAFERRRAVVCCDVSEALRALRGEDPRSVLHGSWEGRSRPVFFLFPGQGAQYPGMAAALYPAEPAFRQALDLCAEALVPELGPDPLAALLAPGDGEALRRTALAQPLLFSVEYALARLLAEWGVEPAAMLGHSLGEYVAACLAGVLPPAAAVRLVAARGRLMEALPEGAMLAVPLSEEELLPRLGADLAVAAVNGPAQVTVAGPTAAVERLARELAGEGVDCRRLHTSHAFHSPMMEGAVAAFRRELQSVTFKPPERRYLSNLTGLPIRAEEATDPEYWVRHLLHPVRFAAGATLLLAEPGALFLEVGPGRTLGDLLRRQPGWTAGIPVIATLPPARGGEPADRALLRAAGRLWVEGVPLDWRGFEAHERRRRVPLPTYSFERETYWIAPRRRGGEAAPSAGEALQVDGPAAAPADEGPDRHLRPGLATAYVAPRNDREQRLSEIWQALLGISVVGVNDDFFDLGGHSLLATQVLARVREAFGTEVPLRRLMEAPTVADLAAAVADASGAPDLPPIERLGGEGAPLSFAQERLLFLDLLEPGSPAYNIAYALRLAGRLDVLALEKSFTEIRRRHEVLRTVLHADDGSPTQRVLPAGEMELPVADLAALPEPRRSGELARLVAANALEPFRLGKGPLFRARLLRLAASAPESWGLLVALHHTVADGWSFGIITRELSALYAAYSAGRPSSLPELPVQYGDYARWQRACFTGEVLESQLAYWRDQLRDLPRDLRLGDASLDPARRDVRGGTRPLSLSAELSRALGDLGRRHRATLYMTLLAGFQALLAFWSGQEDLLVGSPIAGRRQGETEGLVGCFVNTLVLRGDLAGDPTFEELLARTRRTTLDAFAHQDLPFERLVSELRLERDRASTPLFRVWFVLQNTPSGELRLPGVEASLLVPEQVAVRHDLKLDLVEGPQGIHGFFEYRSGLFDEPTVERLAELFTLLLASVAARPEIRFGELCALLATRAREIESALRREMRSAARSRLSRVRRQAAIAN